MWYFAWILGTLLACARLVSLPRWRLSTVKPLKLVKKKFDGSNYRDKLYAVMDKGPLRALSLMMALAACRVYVSGTRPALPRTTSSWKSGMGSC